MTTRRLIATALSTAALAAGTALVAAPAQAAAATHTVEEMDFTIPAHPFYSEVCGFPIELHVWGSFNVVTWTDDSGAVTKEIRNFRFQSTSTANGVSIRGRSIGPEISTVNQDGSTSVQIMGVVNRQIPGQGMVTMRTGYDLLFIDGDVEVLLDSAGPREDVALICSAFGG
jgi:hypothetical protein